MNACKKEYRAAESEATNAKSFQAKSERMNVTKSKSLAKFEAAKLALFCMTGPLVKKKEDVIAEKDFYIAKLNNEELTGKAKLEYSRISVDELKKVVEELKAEVLDAKKQFRRAADGGAKSEQVDVTKPKDVSKSKLPEAKTEPMDVTKSEFDTVVCQI